jgi:hypothetical protein
MGCDMIFRSKEMGSIHCVLFDFGTLAKRYGAGSDMEYDIVKCEVCRKAAEEASCKGILDNSVAKEGATLEDCIQREAGIKAHEKRKAKEAGKG